MLKRKFLDNCGCKICKVGNTDEVEEEDVVGVGPLNKCFHDAILCLFYISWDTRSSEIADKRTSYYQFNV